MKTLLLRFWLEPAVFIAGVVLALNVVQVLLVDDKTVNAALGAVLIALGGSSTRALVSPKAKGVNT